MKLPRHPQGGGQPRRSLWQCLCLTWNPLSKDKCGKCGRPRTTTPVSDDTEGAG